MIISEITFLIYRSWKMNKTGLISLLRIKIKSVFSLLTIKLKYIFFMCYSNGLS